MKILLAISGEKNWRFGKNNQVSVLIIGKRKFY